MKRSILCCVAALFCLPYSTIAQTPEDRLNKTAKAAARIIVIEGFCSNFYLIDRVKTAAVSEALIADGTRRFGRENFNPAFVGAMTNFQIEAGKRGAAIWCPAQRAHLKKAGITDIIGGNL